MWTIRLATPAVLVALAAACGGGGREPEPALGFGVLSGQAVLVLPVQYVRRLPGGWAGGAENAEAAARQADLEIAFALSERGGRAAWVTPVQQVETLKRRPAIRVNPYALSAGEARAEGAKLKEIRDPLYGEIRMLAALFDARYAVWPLELLYEENADAPGGHLAIRIFLLDTRRGDVLWYGVVDGGDLPPASAAALAAAAQAFADRVSP